MLQFEMKSEERQSSYGEVIGKLQELFGDRLSTSSSVCAQHAHTTTWLPEESPDAVFFAETTEEVSTAVGLCNEHGVPVVPFGAGSSLEGNVNAPFGGVSIDFSKMNRIVDVHQEDQDCVVEAGVTRKQLNTNLRDKGLFFPIDPGADATLGGMAATGASGTNAVLYGTMRENVLGLTVVMADGEIVRTGGRSRKSSAGYDLTRLMVGSEGTLGLITELTVKLYGTPDCISGGVCPFPDMESACNAVIATIQYGIPVARIELVDPSQIRASNAYSKLSLAEQPTLFLEFHGTENGVEEQSALFGEISKEFGGGEFVWSTVNEERNKLWQARHDAFWAGLSLKPGCKAFVTDVCVPISRLAECIVAATEELNEMEITNTIVGHVGDGNFHVLLMYDDSEKEKVMRFSEWLTGKSLEFGGTCTGEHGIGQGKMKYLEREHGGGVGIMRGIKAALDPKGILNPGKIFTS